jgi:glycosyltransferase involved in cell wall biosynthesis
VERSIKHTLLFVATTPYAVNAFLRPHLLSLAEDYHVIVFVNSSVYPLHPDISKAVKIEHLEIFRKISIIQDFFVLCRLVKRFWVIKPTLVHSITPKAGFLAMIAAWMTGVPLRFHTFTGQIWANKKGLDRLFFKFIDFFITIFTSQILADSSSQIRFLEREKVVRKDSVVVLGPGSIAGVDLAKFRPDTDLRARLRNERNLSQGRLVFLFVGRIVYDKGISDLIDAFGFVNRDHPNWELWIVGPDEADLKSVLQARAADTRDCVRWFESTLNPARFMRSANILVLPSYREGFGSVIIEAAACGLPSIAYRTEGVIDAVIDDQTGLLVNKGDVKGLSDAMIRLGSDQALRNNLGQFAYERATREFSSSSLVIHWQEFYYRAIKSKNKKSQK